MAAFLSIYILVDLLKPSAASLLPETANVSAPAPLQTRSPLKRSVTPVCIGLVVLFAINIIFVADIELTLRRNRHIQAQGEAEWGFGQVLAVLMLLVPLRDVIEMLLARKEREKNREVMQALLGSMDSSKFADMVIEWLEQGVSPSTKSKGRLHSLCSHLVLLTICAYLGISHNRLLLIDLTLRNEHRRQVFSARSVGSRPQVELGDIFCQQKRCTGQRTFRG